MAKKNTNRKGIRNGERQEKRLCQTEGDGCPSHLGGDTALCSAFTQHRAFLFFWCSVVVIHRIVACQQKGLKRILVHRTDSQGPFRTH